MPKYIDIHSHLNLEQFDSDREEIIQKLKDEDILTITVGVDYLSSLKALELADKYDNLFACVGLHPSDVMIEEFDYDKMLALAKNKKVVAIGECGLDYFRNDNEDFKLKQKEVFDLHIKLSLEVNKPLMIHGRPSKNTMDAYNDILDILKLYKKPARPHESGVGGDNSKLSANFHFFSGNLSIAKRIIDLGFTLSFDGPITFSNDYDEIIKMCPIESIMAETDSPFAAPEPYRGKRAEPQMVKEIVKKIAEIKNLTEEETAKIIFDNARRIFDI
jgi:TatD DNase family protein